MRNKIKKLEVILPIIGISIFAFLLFKVGIRDTLKSMMEIRFVHLIAVLFSISLFVLSQTFKWHIILKKQRIDITFMESLKIQLISLFYGFITPAKIGSLIKIAYLNKKTKNIGRSISSVVIDRAFDMIAVLLFATIGGLVLASHISRIVEWMLPLLVLSVAAFLFLISKSKGEQIVMLIYKKVLPSHFHRKAKKGFDEFYKSIPKKRFLIIPFVLALINWMVIYLPNFIIAKSVGIEIDYFLFVLILSVSTIIGQIPITVSGLGTREASLVGMFALFGIESYKIMSMSILSLILVGVIPALVGFFLSLSMHRLGKRLNKEAE